MTAKATNIREDGREELIVINPATLDELARVLLMSEEEVRGQIRKAQEAFPGWRDTSVGERGRYILKARDYLLDHLDEVATTISKEVGKPRQEALVSDIMIAADLMGTYATRAGEVLADRELPIHLFKVVRQSSIRYEPLGVVSVISPYNYPFSIQMSSVVFALLAGNTVVYKPASDAVLVARRVEEIFRAAGLPEGVVNLVLATGSSVGSALFEPPIKKVAFTGSTETGKWIMREAAKYLIPVSLELGGKDPMIVLDDADVERAAAGAVWGAFTNAGQTCASVERCYVHRSIYDCFIAEVQERVEALQVGEGLDPDVDIGPLVNERQLRIVEEHVADAVERGAVVVTGGQRPPGLKGYFYQPTVLAGVTHEMRCMHEETFGPTLPIMAFDDEDEAVRLANDSEFGLTASIWSQDRKRAERLAPRLEAGTVSVNDHASSYGLPETPWQGVKQSGIGVSHGDQGLLEFVHPKHVTVDRIPLKELPWWYPYSGAKYEAFRTGIRAVLGQGNAANAWEALNAAASALKPGGRVTATALDTLRRSLGIATKNPVCQETDRRELR
jgi:succinate-semialdehyde dehydrogenase/glutarate-semialdehyde dehydrogenase